MKRGVVVVLVLHVAAVAGDVGVDPADARVAYLHARRLRTVDRLVRLLLAQRNVEEARKLLEPEVKRITTDASKGSASVADVRLVYLSGIVEEMAGRRTRRDELFETARKLTPSDEFAHLLIGKAFDELHREDISEAALVRVLELAPYASLHDAEALELLIQSAHTNRRYARAAELCDRLLKMLRRTASLKVQEDFFTQFEYLGMVSLGFALLEETRPGAWQEALAKCERAWKLDPTRIEAPILGERIATRCPDKVRAAKLKETWRARSERVAQLLRRSITAEPREPQNYNALAWFLAELDRNHDEGIRAVTRALELRPGEFAFIDTLAELQFKKGDVQAAIKTIRRVIDVCPYANDYYRHQLDRFEAALKRPKAAGVP